MRFDILSFLIGAAVTAVIAFILYRLRGQLATVRQTAESQAGSTQRYITSSAESRYHNDVTKLLNSYHVAGDTVKLTDIYVEPRFMTALEPVDPTGEKPIGVFHVVPRIHDMPAAYAPYNVETLTINELQAGEPHLALLGVPGSGKSTALAILGLYAAGEIEIEVIDVMSDAVFEDEIKDLPPDQKDKLIQQRQATQDRALEHLKQAQAKRLEEQESERGKNDKKEQATRPVVDFHRLLPVLFHLRDIDLQPPTYGVQTAASTTKDGKSSAKQALKKLDPAEPLVKALQQRFGAITASTIPHLVYNRLNAGTCLVLIDGYEDIAPSERPEKLAWLQQFIATYGANFIVVTGPATGFDPLLHLGLTPVFLRAWAITEFDHLIERWALAWPTIGGKGRKRASMPDERVIRRAEANNRGRLPLDVTLKTWAAFAGDEQEVGRSGWYDFYVRHAQVTKEARPILEKMAAAMLDQGGAPLTREKMKEIATAALAGSDGKPTANVDDLIGKLAGQSDLMVTGPDNRSGFVHPLLAAFLASSALDVERLADVATSPAWELAMPFAAARLAMDRAVTARLGAAPDLLYSNLFGLVSWLPDAPPNAAWRAEIFKRLTAALLAPSQYPAIRERAMAALVASRDKNVTFILRQALRSADPIVRQLGCIGLGALGEGEALKDLGAMLTDPDVDVQLAAGLALGAIGSESALKMMEAGLYDGEQELRQAVAEALAALPGQGHALLREGMKHPETMVRRAVVFGLARVKAAWALALLYRAMEDSQWYVQNAAEEAFLGMESSDEGGAQRHPEAESLPWLVDWAAQRGEGVPAGLGARQVLVRALQEGDPIIRAASALTLANLGHVPALKPLYGALRDKDETVRAAVFEALGSLENRLGEELPAVA